MDTHVGVERTEAAIRATVRAITLDLAPTKPEEEIEDANLIDGLGYHSLGLLELAFTLEDEFGLPPISEEQARSIVTMRDVENYVVAKLAEQG